MDFAVGSFDSINDLDRTLIQDRMVIGFHTDSDDFGGAGHVRDFVEGMKRMLFDFAKRWRTGRVGRFAERQNLGTRWQSVNGYS